MEEKNLRTIIITLIVGIVIGWLGRYGQEMMQSEPQMESGQQEQEVSVSSEAPQIGAEMNPFVAENPLEGAEINPFEDARRALNPFSE